MNSRAVARAIAIVERSRASHVIWRDYYLALDPDARLEAETMYATAGDCAAQEKFIRGYDEVLELLNTLPTTPEDLAEAREAFPLVRNGGL